MSEWVSSGNMVWYSTISMVGFIQSYRLKTLHLCLNDSRIFVLWGDINCCTCFTQFNLNHLICMNPIYIRILFLLLTFEYKSAIRFKIVNSRQLKKTNEVGSQNRSVWRKRTINRWFKNCHNSWLWWCTPLCRMWSLKVTLSKFMASGHTRTRFPSQVTNS